jgi:hypothetical protein
MGTSKQPGPTPPPKTKKEILAFIFAHWKEILLILAAIAILGLALTLFLTRK